VKIGIAQLNPLVGDLRGNHDQILQACNHFAQEQVDLVLTPELSLCGYPPRDLLLDLSFVREMAIALQSIADAIPTTISLLVGTVEFNLQAESNGGKPLFNSAALLSQGQVKQVFHKRLLPTYDVFDEDRYFEPGQGDNWFGLSDRQGNLWRVGVTICEDIWNDRQFWRKRNYASDPLADLAARQVDLVVNLSASPYAIGKPQMRQAMLRHSAIAHNLPMIYANQVGANDDLIFDGNSMAFDARGEIIGQAQAWQVDSLLVEIQPFSSSFKAFDLNLLRSLDSVSTLDQAALQLEDFLLENPKKFPDLILEEILAALVLGVRDYATKCGFRQAVLGLSGGIDSALVAAIATFALGKENVLGILMPSPYSSTHSVSDALELAKNLGISTQTIKIEPMMAAFEQSLAQLFLGASPDITEENLQSRIRGSLLMAISNKFGHLLLSTGNKSEMAVGYCTLYGDMNGGLAVIADVAKTLVYQLCHWLNLRYEQLIPINILTKPPSAELRPGQLDRDSLPDYEILDDILDRLIGDRASQEQIIQAGHCAETVNRVRSLVAKAEFKRRQSPPGLKISNRAFGSGWRMPIASRRTRKD
jgi:NAD+ synthase (glutamine-hydrolysing)